MLARHHDPIVAIATAPGRGAVGIVRVSGKGLAALVQALCGRVLKPREATYLPFRDAQGQAIDQGLALYFPGPHSYTGEDVLELQAHGGPVVLQLLMARCLQAAAEGGLLPRLRPAEPGEFTRRAFLNGRLDLTQAEAICDFIQAKTDRAAHVARAQLDGALGQQVGLLYEQMLSVCAEVEHLLDFDEGELPDLFTERTSARVAEAVQKLERLAATWSSGHLLRDGALVVISGRPNAGKSSLLNALLGRNRAIVHEVPGTTRDVIEEGYALNGVPLRLVDTAGLRETADAVEREGIGRARDFMRQADLNVHLIDSSVPASADLAEELRALPARRTLIGITKCDLPAAGAVRLPPELTRVRLSVKTGAGMAELKTAMAQALGVDEEAYGPPVVSLRHVTELREAAGQGQSAIAALAAGAERLVIAAGHLRAAAEAVGRIVGRVYSDDLLDAIFGRFYVGK